MTINKLYANIYQLRELNFLRMKWVGWAGVHPKNEAEKQELIEEYAKLDCVPVFCTPEMISRVLYYYEMVMSPLLHNFIGDFMNNADLFRKDDWDVFRVFNEIIAAKVVEVATEGEIVWVHDNQLILTPAVLRR